MIGRYNKGNTRGKLDPKKKKKNNNNNNNNGFLGLRRGESQSATSSDTTELETEKGNHFLNANNLLRE